MTRLTHNSHDPTKTTGEAKIARRQFKIGMFQINQLIETLGKIHRPKLKIVDVTRRFHFKFISIKFSCKYDLLRSKQVFASVFLAVVYPAHSNLNFPPI